MSKPKAVFCFWWEGMGPMFDLCTATMDHGTVGLETVEKHGLKVTYPTLEEWKAKGDNTKTYVKLSKDDKDVPGVARYVEVQ